MTPLRCALALLAAAGLYGQTSSRIFHLTTAQNANAQNEIATILRSVGNIQQISGDDVKFEITATGSNTDLATAAWLIDHLDTNVRQSAQYSVPDSSDVVSIVYLSNTPTMASLNEVATSLRAVGKVTHIFTYSSARAITMRTTGDQTQLASWLVRQIDVSGDDKNRWHQPRVYTIAGNPQEIVKVVYLIHPTTQPAYLNEMVTVLRTIADLRSIFTRSEPQGIAFRGTVAQVQLGDWLFQQLDVLPNAQMSAQTHEYTIPEAQDSVTRVYYLNNGGTNSRMNEIIRAVRSEADIRRIFTYIAARALAIRGNPDAVAAADRIIKQQDTLAAQ
jgi:hypothetical protein